MLLTELVRKEYLHFLMKKYMLSDMLFDELCLACIYDSNVQNGYNVMLEKCLEEQNCRHVRVQYVIALEFTMSSTFSEFVNIHLSQHRNSHVIVMRHTCELLPERLGSKI